jgi:F-type H+-transporting ATPase subunit gamma
MKAVTSIKKITKAMKMVAAAKMRSDVARLEAGNKFGVGALQKLFDNESYLQKRKPVVSIKKTLMVPITSDRGLCGSVNTNVVREVRTTVRADRSAYKLFVVGEKG